MDAQGPAYPGSADDLLHEVGILGLQLGEFVHYHYQVGHRLLHLAAFVELYVVVDMVDAASGKHLLTVHQLGLYGHERAVYLPSVYVGDGPHQVGQVGELVGHAAALEVDDDEAYVIRMIQRCHGKDVGLQDLALSRACGSCHQAVRAVGLSLVAYIQIHYFVLAFDSQRRRHGLVDLGLFPSLSQVQVVHVGDGKQLEEGDVPGQLAFQAHLVHIDRSQPSGRVCHRPVLHRRYQKIRSDVAVGCLGDRSRRSLLSYVYHPGAASRQQLLVFLQEHEGEAVEDGVLEVSGNRVLLYLLLIQHEYDEVDREPLVFLALHVLTLGSDVVEVFQHGVLTLLVADDVPGVQILVGHVSQPPHPAESLGVLFGKYVKQLHFFIEMSQSQVQGHVPDHDVQLFLASHYAYAVGCHHVHDYRCVVDVPVLFGQLSRQVGYIIILVDELRLLVFDLAAGGHVARSQVDVKEIGVFDTLFEEPLGKSADFFHAFLQRFLYDASGVQLQRPQRPYLLFLTFYVLKVQPPPLFYLLPVLPLFRHEGDDGHGGSHTQGAGAEYYEGPAASSHDTSQHYDEDYHHQGRDESHHQIPLRRLGLGLRLLYRYLIFRQPVLHSGASVKPGVLQLALLLRQILEGQSV